MKRRDPGYFAGCLSRAAECGKPLLGRFPWLRELQAAADDWVVALTGFPPTLVHGEFYPENMLEREGTILPVDWESAAIGPGEIDLAALVEGWPEPVREACEEAYAAARWPGGPPPELEERLTAARMYQSLRWLGDRPERLLHPALGRQLERLRVRADRLGLLS